MDPAFVERRAACAGVSSGDGRAVADVVFGEVLGARNEGRWGFAGHEKCTGIERVAHGDVAEAVENGVVVEDMVGRDECREDGGQVYCDHVCLGLGEESGWGKV